MNDEFDSSMQGDWANYTWTLNLWTAGGPYSDALAAFSADARHGNYANNIGIAESHVGFGSDYYVTFAPAIPILLAPNTEYLLSIRGQRTGQASKASLRHALMPLPSDYYRAHNYSAVAYASFGLLPGAAALDIFGF